MDEEVRRGGDSEGYSLDEEAVNANASHSLSEKFPRGAHWA